jgi:hypothetical protein
MPNLALSRRDAVAPVRFYEVDVRVPEQGFPNRFRAMATWCDAEDMGNWDRWGQVSNGWVFTRFYFSDPATARAFARRWGGIGRSQVG